MSIKSDAKLIVKWLLDKALEKGSLAEGTFIEYSTLAAEVGIPDENRCFICCEYMSQLGYIRIPQGGNNPLLELTAQGVDFLETS